MSAETPTPGSDPIDCLRRVQEAINAHDLEALTACFAPDYTSEFPAHPERAFSGHGPLRANWTRIFSSVPDIHAELVGSVAHGDTAWAEWNWSGTGADGSSFAMRGVSIQGVRAGRVAWVRMYMEPVQLGGHDLPGAPQRRVS